MWCPKLTMWYNDAHNENNIDCNIINKSYGIFPKSFYERIQKEITFNKVYDYCFIGTLHIDEKTFINRKWILPFIKDNFNDISYLQFTDRKTKKNYETLGIYDHTLLKKGFVPKETELSKRNFFDEEYYSNICKSKFCLCPAGDSPWSMRFYEALMCKSIPIVNRIKETYRSQEESQLDYKYYLSSDKDIVYREDWAEHNYNLFLKYHTLKYAPL